MVDFYGCEVRLGMKVDSEIEGLRGNLMILLREKILVLRTNLLLKAIYITLKYNAWTSLAPQGKLTATGK